MHLIKVSAMTIMSRITELFTARTAIASGLAVCVLAITGCGEPEARFTFNSLYLKYQENELGVTYTETQKQDIVNVTSAIFGSPDDPTILPGVEGMKEQMRPDRLEAAAGPVHSDNYGDGAGLYRQHCVHCHGVTGNGRGPTAEFLNPYPRDFTRGTFKFTSTPVGVKPTDEDLRTTLMNGIAGTAMPSFALLSEGELDALIDYVKYLSMRGETERKLIELNPDFFDAEAPEENESLRQEFYSREFVADEVLADIVASWADAKDMVTEIPERPEEYDQYSSEFDAEALAESIARGRKLYYTNDANCYSCHGPSQLGDGQITDYDQWTKEFYDWTGQNNDEYQERLSQYLAAGGLPPRNIRPRNLRLGIYRGGRRPIDIFWRIANGIDGTPMPAANRIVLSDDDIWDLVNYVLELPYEDTSRPDVVVMTNDRQVN